MEEADLFIDDIDGIFDDEDDGPPTEDDDDDDDHASFGDEEDVHDSSSLAVDACSSFPLMTDDDDDDDDGEEGQPPPKKAAGESSATEIVSQQLDGKEASRDSSSRALPQHDHDTGRQLASTIVRNLGRGSSTSVPRPDSSSSAAVEPSAPASILLPATARRRSVSEPGAANPKHKTMRRSGKHLEAKVCPVPPPSWHSEAADRHHRQAMILDIARLLQARKKTVPSPEWLRQLPHKARKLEERLYRSSTSLEAYLDKATLKTRLKKLARVIARQFEQAKKQRAAGSSATSALGWNQNQHGLGQARHRSSDASAASMMAASVSSMASLAASSTNSASSLRDSFSTVNSMDSLRSFRESLVRRATTTDATGRSVATQSSAAHGINANATSFASLPTHETTGGQRRPSPAASDRQSDADASGEATKGVAAATCTTAPTSSSSTPRSSVSQSAGRPSPPMIGTALSAIGEGNGLPEPLASSVQSAALGRLHQPPYAQANSQAHQQLLEHIRNQQEEGSRRSQVPQAGGFGAAASSVPSLQRSTSNGYSTAGASAAVGATSVPGQAPSAPLPRPFPMFSGMGAALSTSGAEGSLNAHGISNLQMNPSMLALLNQHANAGGVGARAGPGPAFSSMAGTGGHPPASALNSQHLAAAKAALHPSMLASMNNRSMLQQAFLEATGQSLGPGFFGGANPSQFLQHEQQRQLPYPPLYQGTQMMPDNSLLFGSGGGGAPAPHVEPMFPSGARAASMPPTHPTMAGASAVSHPLPLPTGFSQLHSMQGPPAPRSLAPPPATQPAKATTTSEDSEPLSPSSFNWY